MIVYCRFCPGTHGIGSVLINTRQDLRRCRGSMIAGGSIEMLNNRIAEGVFERFFPQRPPKLA